MLPWVADVLFFATALIYLVASGLFVAYLAGARVFASDERMPSGEIDIAKEMRAGTTRVAPLLLLVGVVLHAAQIVVSSFVLHVCPVEGMHFGMSVVSVVACATYLAMRGRYHIDVVGAFVAPLALTFLVASRFVAVDAPEPSLRMRSAILPVHVTVNLLGDALFTLAFAAAVAYLVQENQVKKKRLGGVFLRLPPLDALDQAEHKFLLAGFPLLTIGILTGTIWARRVEGGVGADVGRALFGYATWLLFAAVLFLRAAAGWRGRRAAYGTIAGFGFAVVVLILYLLKSLGGAGDTVAWLAR